MAQSFHRLVHPGDAPHLAIALKRYVTNITTSYSLLDSPVFTGDPQAPTPPTPDNDTSIATTAFVKNQNYAPLVSPVFTGDPHAPTPALGDSDTSIATTAFIKAQGYQTGNQTITLSGDIAGSGTTAIPTTLATVNTNVGTFQGLTLDGKGRVIAAVNQNYLTAAVAGSTYAPLASPNFTGTPNAPAYYVGGHNVTPGQIGAASAWPNTSPATGPSGMQGLAYTFTPQSSTRVLVVITGSITLINASAAGTVFLMRGTGAPPGHGTALTGTQVLAQQVGNTLPASVQIPCPLIAVIGGLTIGTTYWFDVYMSISAGNGGYFNGGYSFLEV